MDLPIADQVQVWRQKQREGTITDEELMQAIRTIRAGRISASESSSKARAKVEINTDSILDNL